jgi:hypothetical protein
LRLIVKPRAAMPESAPSRTVRQNSLFEPCRASARSNRISITSRRASYFTGRGGCF